MYELNKYKYLNPTAITRNWVGESSLRLLKMAQNTNFLKTLSEDPVIEKLQEKIIKNPQLLDPKIYNHIVKIQMETEKKYNEYIKNGKFDDGLLKSAINLAQVDVIYRAGIIVENFGNADEKDIEDLRNLISIVPKEQFIAKKICTLNPTFGKASKLVVGADADIIIDNKIIDIKTTKKLELRRDDFNQLIGYYILSKIGEIDGLPSQHEIKQVGIYFSRYGYLYTIDLFDIMNSTSPSFIDEFKEKAIEKYGFKI